MKQMNAKNKKIEDNVIKNIEALVEARDNSIHFFSKTSNIDKLIREIGLATIQNYISIIKEWFDKELDEFGFCLVPISVINIPKDLSAMVGNAAEKNFVEYLSSLIEKQEQNTHKSIGLVVDVKLNKSSNSYIKFQVVKDSEKKITISEEDNLKNYPFEYKELCEKMRNRYSNFKQDKKFNNYMAEIKNKPDCCLTRYLNPKSKKHSKQFYNSNVFNYFDEKYDKKKDI
jgi:hypothetical protein